MCAYDGGVLGVSLTGCYATDLVNKPGLG